MTKRWVVARFPSPPDPLGSLAGVDVACPFHTKATVFFVPAMDAVTTDKPIKSRSNCFCGTTGFNEYPYLDHVTGFPVIRRGFETGCDNDPLGILVENEAIAHRRPPIHSARAGMAINRRNPRRQSRPWNLGGMRSFMII
jgi:hypothetical protein